MRKLFKKALACCLVAALALTCFVGALSVSAETAAALTGKIEVGTVEVADDATTATVPVVITSDNALNAAKITVAASEGWEVSAIAIDAASTAAKIEPENINGDTFIVEAFDNIAGFTTATVNVTFTSKAAVAATITATLDPVHAATWNEDVVNLAVTDGAITVKAAEPEGPVVDANLKFASASVGYGTSSLQVAFRINNTVLNSYADMEVVIIPDKYDASFNLIENPAEIVVNKSALVAAGSTRKQYYYTDIQLYEIGLDINYMLRAYDAEGNLVAISDTFTTSVADYLKTSYAASSDPKFRTVVADTLIVGDEAAKNFGTAGSDLAAAPSIIEGFDTSAATAVLGAYNTVNNLDSKDADYGTASSNLHQVRTSAQIGKAPFINFRIADQAKALDFNKLSVKVTYTSKDSAGDHPYERTFTGSDFTYAGKYINCKFEEIGLHDGDKDITFVVTYDGVEKCTLTYSVESYLGANLTSSIGALAESLIKLGGSFRAYAVG